MPTTIKPEDRPVTVAIDQSTPLTSYVIRDAKGEKRALFFEQAEANAFAEMVNEPEPVLMQSNMRDTGIERDKDRAQSKEKAMPRGIPKKKKAKKAVKKAAVVKKTVQKTMKRRKKKKA